VRLFGEGTFNGAVYSPVSVIVPTVLFPPAIPLTLQFTAVLAVPVTVAANCTAFPTSTSAAAGDSETRIGCGVPPRQWWSSPPHAGNRARAEAKIITRAVHKPFRQYW
jgi:hypothetical protein